MTLWHVFLFFSSSECDTFLIDYRFRFVALLFDSTPSTRELDDVDNVLVVVVVVRHLRVSCLRNFDATLPMRIFFLTAHKDNGSFSFYFIFLSSRLGRISSLSFCRWSDQRTFALNSFFIDPFQLISVSPSVHPYACLSACLILHLRWFKLICVFSMWMLLLLLFFVKYGFYFLLLIYSFMVQLLNLTVSDLFFLFNESLK